MTSQTELGILTALRSMDPLHDLDGQHLKKLASIAVEQEFPEGEIIYKEGDLDHRNRGRPGQSYPAAISQSRLK